MRDPRFVDRVTWDAQKGEARSRASSDLDALTRERAVAGAAAAALLQVDEVDWIPLAATALPKLPRAIFDDLGAFLLGRIDLSPASWLVVGAALARVAIDGAPDGSRLQAAAVRLERSPAWVYDVFFDTCADEVRALPDQQREAWLRELERPVAFVEAAPATGRVTVSHTPRRWRLDDVFDMWGHRSMAIVAIGSHSPITLLRALDFDRWFHAVDRWEDGRLVGGALLGDHLLHDRAALLRALRLAADVFDSSGSWTGRTAGVILIDLVLGHALGVYEETRGPGSLRHAVEGTEALRELCEVELPTFFTDVWSVLLARRDGLPIAAALHADLCAVVRDDAVRAVARAALARRLAAGNVRTADLRDLWSRRRRLRGDAGLGARREHASGVNLILSALGVVEAGGPKDGDLLELFVDRIREPDPHWRILVTAQVLKPTLDRILEGLGNSATALSRFSTLYQQLEPARRRGEYGRTYTKSDDDLSSLLCLLIVLGLLDEPTVPAPQRDETLDRAIGWSVRMLLTSAPANEPTISVERVFAAALRLAARFASPRLNAALAVTATDPTLSAWVIALLARELPRGDLDNLLRPVGLTVESVVERARWFALLTGRTADKAAVAAVEQAFAQPLSLSPTNG